MHDKTFFMAKGLKIILNRIIPSGFTLNNKITEREPFAFFCYPALDAGSPINKSRLLGWEMVDHRPP